jgi:hypothetical protein
VDGSVLVGELRIHLDEEVLAQPLKWKKKETKGADQASV